MEQYSLLEKIYNEFREIVQNHFSDMPYSGGGYAGPQFHINLPSEYKQFKQSDYYYAGKSKTFIHWTTIEKLLSILNSREIRLYNLVNSEDENEFNYAAKKLNLDRERVKLIKENYFTFSFCEEENLYNKELWSSYGKNYQGVALKISIINDLDDWDKYLISEIRYSPQPSFEKFADALFQLRLKYQDSSISLDYDIWKFAGFHKEPNFKFEKEVRISAIFPFNNFEEFLRSARKEFRIEGSRNRIVTYIPLKLWIDFEGKQYPKAFYTQDYIEKFKRENSKRPQIKIENIYFGCNCGINQQELYEYIATIEELISFQFGYPVHLEQNLFRLA